MKYADVLEATRIDKIKDLGFIGYNLYVDGIMSFPEMYTACAEIKSAINSISALRRRSEGHDTIGMQERRLDAKLIELGCVCYNLYVDNRLFDGRVLSLCGSISTINSQISAIPQQPDRSQVASYGQTEENALSEEKNVTQSKMKITCPYGMEPIPEGFKRCVCGYRNRPDAKFCGKCGARLS